MNEFTFKVAALAQTTEIWVALPELASALVPHLRPLLAQPPQPAANVLALDAAKQRAELQLADAWQEIEMLRAQAAAALRERASANAYANQMREERNEANVTLNAVIRERDEYAIKNDTLRIELHALRDRAHAAEGQLGALRRDLEAAYAEIAELTADRDSWREERQRLAGRVARAHAALADDPVLSED